MIPNKEITDVNIRNEENNSKSHGTEKWRTIKKKQRESQ